MTTKYKIIIEGLIREMLKYEKKQTSQILNAVRFVWFIIPIKLLRHSVPSFGIISECKFFIIYILDPETSSG